MEKFDTFFQEQHPETVIEGWLDLPESEPFRLTEATFGQSNFTDSETGGYSTNCILTLEDTRGQPRRVWSCKSLIKMMRKEVPLDFTNKGYFVMNKGVKKTGSNRTFHQSGFISVPLDVANGVTKKKKKRKKTTTPAKAAAPPSSSLTTPTSHSATKTVKGKQLVVAAEKEVGDDDDDDDDDFIIASRQPTKKARRKQVAR